MKQQVTLLLILSLFLLVPSLYAEEEETSEGLTVSFEEIVDIIEARCPCAEIGEEEEEEEELEESDEEEAPEMGEGPESEIPEKSSSFCRSKLANPGKFKQGVRFLSDLGLLSLGEDESLKDVFDAFKEARKDCRGKKGKKPGKKGPKGEKPEESEKPEGPEGPEGPEA